MKIFLKWYISEHSHFNLSVFKFATQCYSDSKLTKLSNFQIVEIPRKKHQILVVGAKGISEMFVKKILISRYCYLTLTCDGTYFQTWQSEIFSSIYIKMPKMFRLKAAQKCRPWVKFGLCQMPKSKDDGSLALLKQFMNLQWCDCQTK